MRLNVRRTGAIFFLAFSILLKLITHPYDENAREKLYEDFLRNPADYLLNNQPLLEKFLLDRNGHEIEITFHDPATHHTNHINKYTEFSVEEIENDKVRICSKWGIAEMDCDEYFKDWLYPSIQDSYFPDATEEEKQNLLDAFNNELTHLRGLECITNFEINIEQKFDHTHSIRIEMYNPYAKNKAQQEAIDDICNL